MAHSVAQEYKMLIEKKEFLEFEARHGIEERKAKLVQIQEINDRLLKLEETAKIIGNDLYCQLSVYKLCSGMDTLDISHKEQCVTFGATMNAIEGIGISDETASRIEEWKNGYRTYLSVFEETLNFYGFPTEIGEDTIADTVSKNVKDM